MFIWTGVARLERVLKKYERRLPGGLKSARNDKIKRLRRWPKGQLYLQTEFFRRL